MGEVIGIVVVLTFILLYLCIYDWILWHPCEFYVKNDDNKAVKFLIKDMKDAIRKGCSYFYIFTGEGNNKVYSKCDKVFRKMKDNKIDIRVIGGPDFSEGKENELLKLKEEGIISLKNLSELSEKEMNELSRLLKLLDETSKKLSKGDEKKKFKHFRIYGSNGYLEFSHEYGNSNSREAYIFRNKPSLSLSLREGFLAIWGVN